VSANTTTSVRTGDIDVTIGGQKKTVSVSQVALYVSDPSPASFVDLPVVSAMSKMFTISTNAPDNSITVTTTNSSLITNLTPLPDAVASDGSSTWAILFDVSANTTTSARSGTIEVTIGGQKKTVNVSQVAMYVNTPVPANISNVIAAGITGKTFTITTNAPDNSITVTTTNPSLITNLTSLRRAAAAEGTFTFTWTIGFDVTENTTTSVRTGDIDVTIGGQKKTVTISQLVTKWTPPTDMHDGLSNCYMVVPGNTVTFPITRAITIGGLSASATATPEILWDDNSVITGTPTLSGSGTSRTITVNTSSKKGNAVIALKDGSGTIYWSWHIWVTDYTGSAIWTRKGLTFMDRNLGATDNKLNLASRGLFYQWSRKDPFPGGKAGTAGYAALGKFKGMADAGSTAIVQVTNTATSGDGIMESIRKPTTFFCYVVDCGGNWLPVYHTKLWNTSKNEKNVYDPCPEGWRIPLTEEYYLFPFTSGSWECGSDNGGLDLGTNAKFPAAGRRFGSHFYSIWWYSDYVAYWYATSTGGGTSVDNMDSVSCDGHTAGTVFNTDEYEGLSVRCAKE
jgi:hypothetical protein